MTCVVNRITLCFMNTLLLASLNIKYKRGCTGDLCLWDEC